METERYPDNTVRILPDHVSSPSDAAGIKKQNKKKQTGSAGRGNNGHLSEVPSFITISELPTMSQMSSVSSPTLLLFTTTIFFVSAAPLHNSVFQTR